MIGTACLNTATEAMRTTSSYKKGRNSGCAPVFTKADTANRWCDVEQLTLRFPFQQCIASASNNYCGIAGKSVCIADKYYDCCPLQKDVVAGVAIAVGVALCIIQWAIYRSCYTRKLIKRIGHVVGSSHRRRRAEGRAQASETLHAHPRLRAGAGAGARTAVKTSS